LLGRSKYQLLADALNDIGCQLHDNRNQYVPLTVVQMLEQVRQRKLIECLLDNARVELFVPAVPLQEELLRRAILVEVRGSEIPITTAEDLILLKLIFHRPKDLHDVRGILWVQRGKLDYDYMKHWSARTHEVNVQQEMEQLIAEYSREE
jgi:predicted nucleotidyltransferase